MKKYICSGMEECKLPKNECFHAAEHSFIKKDDKHIGCDDIWCGMLNRKVSCIDIRKMKLKRLGEVVYNQEVI